MILLSILKVSSKSIPRSVAKAIAGVVKEEGRADLQVIGAGALNQAIKAIAIARLMVARQGMDLVCAPSFVDLDVGEGKKKTGIKISVEPKQGAD